MYQLESKVNREHKIDKIEKTLEARRMFNEAGIALLECDEMFAYNVKHTLESMTFASKIINIIGAGGSAQPIDASSVRFYLQIHHRICVREENITVNLEKRLCSIKLNDKITAEISISDCVAAKTLTVL